MCLPKNQDIHGSGWILKAYLEYHVHQGAWPGAQSSHPATHMHDFDEPEMPDFIEFGVPQRHFSTKWSTLRGHKNFSRES